MKKLVKLLTAIVLALTVSVPAVALTACNRNSEKEIVVGASPTPHAEILRDVVAAELAKEGYTLKITEYNDYVLPNTAVEYGDIDANYFQHIKYMNEFNESRGTHLVAVAYVHYEPFGIYRGKYTSGELKDLPNGSQVLVPNDPTNEARALFLLQEAGLIRLRADVNPLEATKADIQSNPKNLDIKELEAAQCAKSLQDAAIAVINGNYAIGEGLKLEDAVVAEDIASDVTSQYINVLAVKAGSEKSPKIQALIKALISDAVKDYIADKYNGAVLAVPYSIEDIED